MSKYYRNTKITPLLGDQFIPVRRGMELFYPKITLLSVQAISRPVSEPDTVMLHAGNTVGSKLCDSYKLTDCLLVRRHRRKHNWKNVDPTTYANYDTAPMIGDIVSRYREHMYIKDKWLLLSRVTDTFTDNERVSMQNISLSTMDIKPSDYEPSVNISELYLVRREGDIISLPPRGKAARRKTEEA